MLTPAQRKFHFVCNNICTINFTYPTSLLKLFFSLFLSSASSRCTAKGPINFSATGIHLTMVSPFITIVVSLDSLLCSFYSWEQCNKINIIRLSQIDNKRIEDSFFSLPPSNTNRLMAHQDFSWLCDFQQGFARSANQIFKFLVQREQRVDWVGHHVRSSMPFSWWK